MILSIPDEGYSECTWWRLFWVYLMKVILSVPDEGYFECTWWRLFWVYLMKVILSIPDEGYYECTWWRLFWVYLMKVSLSVPDEDYFECTWWRLFWVYLMKIILSVQNNFQSFICEKERIWGNGMKTVQNHPMQHTKICSMKQLFELSSLMVKISLEFWTQKYMP